MRSRLPLLREYFEISLRALRFPFQIIRLHLPVSFQPIWNGVRCFTHDSLLAFGWTKASVAGLLGRLVAHPKTCLVIVSARTSFVDVELQRMKVVYSPWCEGSLYDSDLAVVMHLYTLRVWSHYGSLSPRPLSMLWCLEKGLVPGFFIMRAQICLVWYRLGDWYFWRSFMGILLSGDTSCIGITYAFYVSPACSRSTALARVYRSINKTPLLDSLTD
jgi:hypothetical protein